MAAAGWPQLAALYRSVLRVHRHVLPPPLRALGDAYAREEFHRHLAASPTAAQWAEFGREWASYVGSLAGRPQQHGGAAPVSGHLSEEALAAMSPAQLHQLAALMEAAQEAGRALTAAPQGSGQVTGPRGGDGDGSGSGSGDRGATRQ